MGNFDIQKVDQYYDAGLRARVTESSRTWKERHAKGVPVKLNARQAIEWNNLSHVDGPVNYFYTWDRLTDEPVIWITDDHDYPGPTGPDATFCNFRYKPEWLEKKGGNHA